MDSITTEVLNALQFLLPGFIAAWIFHGLTPFPKPEQFERVVEALIFTMVIQALVVVVSALATWVGNFWAIGEWSGDAEVVWSVILAALVGLLFSRWSNHDTLHKLLRKLRFTSLSSYPSEWYSAFDCSRTYVVLHLTGERRLYGWPEQWPSDPRRGQFWIAEAEWLLESERIPLAGVEKVLIPASEVQMVEFMHLESEQ